MNALVRTVVGLSAIGLLALAGCGKGDTSSSAAGSGSGAAVKTGPGITNTTITLGDLTDLSGAFAVLGKTITDGNQLYIDKVNSSGGVCGRQLKLIVKDHGYNVQKAVSAYGDTTSQVAGYLQLLGSPMTSALLDNIKSDKIITAPASWASTLLANPYIMISGTTYDIEMINGIDYLLKQGKIAKGDKIGHIYIQGEYGANGLIGSKYAAQADGLTLVEQQVKATDTDMSGAVTALKSAGVKAILLTTTPTQTASAAGAAASQGFNVPVLGNNPTYLPQLLKTPAGPALTANYLVVQSAAPFTDPSAKDVAAAFKSKYPDVLPNAGVTYGYAVAEAYVTILKTACKNGDLSRDGIVTAFRQTTGVDTGGLLPSLDFSKPGASPSNRVIILKPDASVDGGETVVQQLFVSNAAKGYRAPAQQG